MDDTNVNPQPMSAESAPAMPEAPMASTPIQSAPIETPAKKSSFGPLIGAGIIILILIAGALYFWSPLLTPGTQNTPLGVSTDGIDADSQVSAAAASVDTLQAGIDQDLNDLAQ